MSSHRDRDRNFQKQDNYGYKNSGGGHRDDFRGGHDQGGRGRGGFRGGRGGFQGNHGDRQQAVAIPATGGKIDVSSNQFILKIAPHTIVHQYTIDVDPEDFFENDKFLKIVGSK